jgi:hypothetical protein
VTFSAVVKNSRTAGGESGLVALRRVPAVQCVPGMMQFTLMPYGASSIAAVLVKCTTPALAAP